MSTDSQMIHTYTPEHTLRELLLPFQRPTSTFDGKVGTVALKFLKILHSIYKPPNNIELG